MMNSCKSFKTQAVYNLHFILGYSFSSTNMWRASYVQGAGLACTKWTLENAVRGLPTVCKQHQPQGSWGRQVRDIGPHHPEPWTERERKNTEKYLKGICNKQQLQGTRCVSRTHTNRKTLWLQGACQSLEMLVRFQKASGRGEDILGRGDGLGTGSEARKPQHRDVFSTQSQEGWMRTETAPNSGRCICRHDWKRSVSTSPFKILFSSF